MQVSITGRRIDLTEEHREFIHERLMQLKKFFDSIMDVHVTLEKEKHRTRADITIQVNGMTMHGEDETDDFYSSIESAISKIEKQIKKHKDRLKDRRTGKRGPASENSIRYKMDIISGEDMNQGTQEPRVISTRTLAFKPLTLDEALMQMDLLNQEFLVFRNSDTNRVNVLNRRPDGNYNLVEEA